MPSGIAKLTAWTALLVIVALGALWLARHLGIWRDRSDRERLAEERGVHAVRDVTLLGTLPDALRETSGIAVSRTQEGLYWTHNDSGDDPALYAITGSGDLIARYVVEGVGADDWEDIALGPCPDSGACLYVADTGDNRARRGRYAVVVVPEPTVVAGESFGHVAGRAVRFVYPDGAHDAEAVAVTPGGDVVIVTRGRYRRIAMYQLAREQIEAAWAGQDVVAQARGSPGIMPHRSLGRVVTGAALSPDGATLALRTLNEIYLFAFDSLAIGEPRARCYLGDLEPQGEAVDFLDGDTFVLASEASGARRGTIHRVRCP